MSEYQTTINNLNVVRGNGMVEVAPYVDGNPDWHNVGAITDLSVEEQTTIAKEENDNADSTDRISKQELLIKFTQLEILNLDIWEILRGSLDTIEMGSDSTKIFSGNKSEIPYFMIRVTTKNNNKPFYLTAYKCNLQKGFSFKYEKDDGEDSRIKNPIEIIARTDPYRNNYVWEIDGDYNG